MLLIFLVRPNENMCKKKMNCFDLNSSTQLENYRENNVEYK